MIVTNAGELILLDWALRSAGGSMQLRLFKNDVVIDADTVFGDLTECDFTGYAARPLARANWSSPITNGTGQAEIAYADQLFSFGSGQDVHGYFVTDSGNNLIMAHKYPAALSKVGGDSLLLQPRIRLNSLPASPSMVTNAGELILLDWIFKSTGADTRLKLYSNDYTPVAGSTPGDFTEANFTGYAAKNLVRGSWNAPSTNVQLAAEIAYSAVQTWTPTSNQTIYGYYVTNVAGDTVLYARKFVTPVSVTNGVDYSLQPYFDLRSAV